MIIPFRLLSIAMETVDMVWSLASREDWTPWAGEGGGALMRFSMRRTSALQAEPRHCSCMSPDRRDVSVTKDRSVGGESEELEPQDGVVFGEGRTVKRGGGKGRDERAVWGKCRGSDSEKRRHPDCKNDTWLRYVTRQQLSEVHHYR